MLFRKRKFIKRVTVTTFNLLLLLSFLLFVVLPLVYKYSYSLQRSAVFLNFVNNPSNADYNHPSKYGLEGVRNFYLTTDDGATLGIWQILPENLADDFNQTDENYFENILGNGQNVVIYSHGNGGTRLTSHRIETYKVLRKHFHVVAYDYRSYGDSSNDEPSEEAVVRDCISVYKWVANRTTGNLFVWGHSLGTSVATRSLAILQESEIKRPTGLILEAPFNNMKDEISEFPLAMMFRHLPWFKFTVVEPMQENNFKFETDKHICKVNVHIMILHALDDYTVPYKLGYKLYNTALKCRTEEQGKVEFYKYDASYHFGHKHLYKAPDIHERIEDFISKTTEANNSRNEVI